MVIIQNNGYKREAESTDSASFLHAKTFLNFKKIFSNRERTESMVNHINNTTRPKLHGSTPMKKALKSFDKNAMEKLGLEIIPPDEICLKPELLK